MTGRPFFFSMSEADAYCEGIVRRFDEDRYLASVFAPARVRPHLFALYAFNFEVAKTAEAVTNPIAGQIRLQWWRDAIDGIFAGTVRDHPVAKALASAVRAHELPRHLFDELIDAREHDLEPEPFAESRALTEYANSTSGHVMRLAARILGMEAGGAARSAGLAYALVGIARAEPFNAARGRAILPPGTTREELAARALDLYMETRAWSRRLLPALLPAVLVPLYVKSLNASVPRAQKQRAMAWAMLRGRL